MSKAPEIAPALPAGCVDFNKLHAALAKGDEGAVEKAVVVPDTEKAPVAEDPAPATTAKAE